MWSGWTVDGCAIPKSLRPTITSMIEARIGEAETLEDGFLSGLAGVEPVLYGETGFVWDTTRENLKNPEQQDDLEHSETPDDSMHSTTTMFGDDLGARPSTWSQQQRLDKAENKKSLIEGGMIRSRDRFESEHKVSTFAHNFRRNILTCDQQYIKSSSLGLPVGSDVSDSTESTDSESSDDKSNDKYHAFNDDSDSASADSDGISAVP